MPQCFLDHRGLYVLGKHRQRSGNIIRDAIHAEIPQVSYKVVNAFDLDLNVHVRSKEKSRIALVGNPASAEEHLPAVQPVDSDITPSTGGSGRGQSGPPG